MKLATLAILLSCFALTSLATATNTVDFSNGGGTLSGTNAGLTLSGSTLIAVIGLNGGGMVTGDLGTVSFTTGALASGSLEMGGTLAAGGISREPGVAHRPQWRRVPHRADRDSKAAWRASHCVHR